MPAYEQERLFFVRSTGLLDTKASEAFDRITRLAASLLQVPMAAISIVDESRQWFKSRVGIDDAETARSDSFCTHTIEASNVLVVEDARLDPRFTNNRMVTGAPGIRFYAGVPLQLPTGHTLGSLCVIDTQPRKFNAQEEQLLRDLGALTMAQIDLHQMAGRVNEVTRLPNRAQLADDLTGACSATPGMAATLVLLEVMSNTQLQSAVRAVGIPPLEAALRTIATNIMKSLPDGVDLYHVGETRFAAIYTADAGQPDDIATALLARMSEPFVTQGGITVQLEAHAGLVRFHCVETETADVLRMATTALYQAEAEQRPWSGYSPEFDMPHRRAFALLRAIPVSLAQGEFRLVYQPKLDLHTARISGVEALARWRHPKFGDVSPAEFIELMERTTLIHEFTEWVLHKALEQQSIWRAQGMDLTIAINVSARNLEHPHFLQMLRNACALHRVQPKTLRLECTENAVMTGTLTAATLEAVRAMDIAISLDDFGVGYSNLSCLHSMPVEILKLDQSLIKPIATDERAFTLIQSLIRMGHALGYRMLAEGVETAEVLDLLKHHGCDAAQGYYISRPLEAQALPEFMQAPRGPHFHGAP
ncbi:sensor domain-containing phosphodiesterase [Acidovorax sp. CCYZU-2555]|uniref:putative bifunctional diguanylate cyclase/phosphodiesterase n=1 Tax=Acidovorax sp. CCYZU-2555 TaxID=2835042 RepID=UPI001BD00833|nr:sensor domain-containing phosphodiesterase [Acidovorax sp. CCYZU-2555]MBS7781100.1 sensor domain-containing phosphodiesterase [Acidovorax sp. CCYZU-2555]